MKNELLAAASLAALLDINQGAVAQSITIPVALNSSTVIATASTVTLPSGWHNLDIAMIGGAGGPGCGMVNDVGAATSGGGSGGAGWFGVFSINAADVANTGSIIVNPGTAGASCVASGTTATSTGSAPANGGPTTVIVNGKTITAFGGGSGSNGAAGAVSTGGGSGGQASGGNGNTGGGNGGANGGSGASPSAVTSYGSGSPGSGTASGAVGNGPNTVVYGASAGASGGGINAGGTLFAGGSLRIGIFGTTSVAGAITCDGTTQNGGVGIPLSGLIPGAPGSGGASCTNSHGGNGGDATGYGASGGGGGSAITGQKAGSGGASGAGAVRLNVSQVFDSDKDVFAALGASLA